MRIKFFSILLIFFAVGSLTTFGQVGQKGWQVGRVLNFEGDLNAVYFSNKERGWVGGDEGFLATTRNGGRNWTKQNIGATMAVNDVYFRGSDKGYVLAGSKIFTSTDGGDTWREESPFRAGEFGKTTPEFYSLRFANKKKGWIVGSVSQGDAVVDSLVMQTEDGGDTWRRVPMATKEELIHLDFKDEERGWMVGALGLVYATTDGGKTWRLQKSGTTGAIYHVDFQNKNLGLVVGEKGFVARTENGGNTWQRVKIDFPNTLLSVKFVNDKYAWAVGRGGLILVSNDGGKTWIKQNIASQNNFYALNASNMNSVWVVGKQGTIAKFVE